jgi:hypothetical protein
MKEDEEHEGRMSMTNDEGGRGRYPIERGCARKQIAVAGITGVEQAGTGGANFVDALKLV